MGKGMQFNRKDRAVSELDLDLKARATVFRELAGVAA